MPGQRKSASRPRGDGEPEWTRALVIGTLGCVPIAGSLLAEALGEVWMPAAQERVLMFLKEVDCRLRELETRRDGFSWASLQHDVDFLDYARDLVLQVAKSSDRSRHETLRHALLNTAIQSELVIARARLYRELVNRFSPIHVHVLRYLHAPPSGSRGARIKPSEVDAEVARLVCFHVPDLANETDLIQVIARELRTAGLLVFPDYVPTVLGPEQAKLFEMRGSRLSGLGLGFLRFISDPEEPLVESPPTIP